MAARWQHGPTPGVKVLGAWVTTVSWGDSNEGLGAGRTYIAFEADTPEQVAAFTGYLHFVSARIAVRPVLDYLPFMQAYEARDPEQYPMYPPGLTDEARRRQVELHRQYIAAPNPAEAARIWRASPGAATALEAAKLQRPGGA